MEAYSSSGSGSNKRAAIRVGTFDRKGTHNNIMAAGNATKKKTLRDVLREMEKENAPENVNAQVAGRNENQRNSTRAEALSVASQAIKGAEDMTKYLSQVTAGTNSGRVSRVASLKQKEPLSALLQDVQARRGSLCMPLRMSSCAEAYQQPRDSALSVSSGRLSQEGYTDLFQHQAKEQCTSVVPAPATIRAQPQDAVEETAQARGACSSINTLRSICIQQELEHVAMTPERPNASAQRVENIAAPDPVQEGSWLTDSLPVELPSETELEGRRARRRQTATVWRRPALARAAATGLTAFSVLILFIFTLLFLFLTFYALPSENGVGFHSVPV